MTKLNLSRHENNSESKGQESSPFNQLMRVDDGNREYWMARELMCLLGYRKWQHFNKNLTLPALKRRRFFC